MISKTLTLLMMFGVVSYTSAQQPKGDFSLTDRAKGEQFMAAVIQQSQAISQEPNAVVRDDKLDELKTVLKECVGKFVIWEYPVRFSEDGRAVVFDAPSGHPYRPTTSSYGGYRLALTAPQLKLGRDLDTATFRKLKGGERVKFKAFVVADYTPTGVSFNLVGRIVEDPFGQPIKFDAFQAKSTWAGQCVVGAKAPHSLKVVVTERTKDSFRGTCTELEIFGGLALEHAPRYDVTGKLDGDKATLTIHRSKDQEPLPYFTTFKGTITDGFLMMGTCEGGTCQFSLVD